MKMLQFIYCEVQVELLCSLLAYFPLIEKLLNFFLVGFNNYKLRHFDQAFDCFKTVCSQSNDHYNAVAFNMIGYCYALQVG